MRSKVSILFFQSNPIYGAVEEYLSILIKGIGKYRNYHPMLVCPNNKAIDRLANETKEYAVVYRYPVIKNGIRETIYFYNLFRKLKPDVIHCNDIGLHGMIAAIMARIRYKIVTYHTPTLDIRYNIRGEIANMLTFAAKWHIIALSKTLKEVMVKKMEISDDNITVIHYGLDSRKFRKINIDACEMRKRLDIPQDKFVVVNAARLSRQKAQHILIQSIKYLPRDLYDRIVILIAGEGELRGDLEELIQNLNFSDKIKLLGHREEIPEILNCANLFVLCSDFEGTPSAIIEAMAMEKPIVATDIDGVKDIVVNGVTGLLIPPGNPVKLAESIETLSKNRKKMLAMGAEGEKRFKNYFTKEKMIQETHKFYSEITQNEYKR